MSGKLQQVLSRRSVLRAGYAAVLGVLVVSAVEAYRIQMSVSQQHEEIYRRYVEEEREVTTLRRNLWLAGNYVRDFFIRTSPEQARVLSSQLAALEAEDAQALALLARISPQSGAGAELANSLNEFWQVVKAVPDAMLNASDEQKFNFLQREIVPRRGELYAALLGLSAADQRRLQENDRAFAGSRRDAAMRLLLMLGVCLLLAIAVALVSLRHAENLERQADRHYAEVEQARKELQQLSARLLEIEEEGRRRLSRELHDEIGQTLALLQIQVTNAQAALDGPPGPLRAQLERARWLAENAVQTIRNISLLLRPALLDDLGLVPALQFQLEDFQRRSGIACEFEEEDVAEDLSDAVKTCAYRVVQEALHNCEKHAGASKVRVAVRQTAEGLIVQVQDDGRGFLCDEKRITGLGLLGMRERAANAGGSLAVDSAPGSGTRIELRIPLAARSQGPALVEEVNV